MDTKIIQKLEELAERIKFGNYIAKFAVHNGKITKIIISETEEIVLVANQFDKSERV